jgi:hypothetical protein
MFSPRVLLGLVAAPRIEALQCAHNECTSLCAHCQYITSLRRDPVWQKRFYDFNVWSERKRVEKLRYMHRNPVKRGLVERPEQWKWSSFRAYLYGETGPVRVKFQERTLGIKRRPVESFAAVQGPVIRKVRE